jgi:ribosome-binding factor A
MPSRRVVQVSNLIKQELGDLLQRELKDPRIGFITLTHVNVSPDMRLAKVYFSVLGDTEDYEQSLAALESAAGFLRRELGRRITIRHVPRLEFILDRSVEQSQHIFDLLRQVREENPSEEE